MTKLNEMAEEYADQPAMGAHGHCVQDFMAGVKAALESSEEVKGLIASLETIERYALSEFPDLSEIKDEARFALAAFRKMREGVGK